jgi:hypothetical protein
MYCLFERRHVVVTAGDWILKEAAGPEPSW